MDSLGQKFGQDTKQMAYRCSLWAGASAPNLKAEVWKHLKACSRSCLAVNNGYQLESLANGSVSWNTDTRPFFSAWASSRNSSLGPTQCDAPSTPYARPNHEMTLYHLSRQTPSELMD